MAYELWLNCSSYEHNIEQKGLVLSTVQKHDSQKLSIIGHAGFICNTVRNNHVAM